ncbi:MAG: DUF1707 domain-containing protein [Gemmatimonadota bacterium]|nr:DUF1707 domain-containing protein [Gemmatimonadota bacterium]
MHSRHPPVALAAARERAIELLSLHFANDLLTMDELDQRLEKAYAATSLAQLHALTADLPAEGRTSAHPSGAPAPVALGEPEESGRIVAIFSETRRGGLWAVPPRLDVTATLSNLTLDLRSARLSVGVTDVHVKAVMASIQVILPPGVRVVESVRAFMASVTDDSYSAITSDPSVPVIRLTGHAVMAEVKVRTKPHKML